MLFKDAKVGDKVAMPYRNGDIDRATISKVTPTQVVVGDERYRRDNGYRIGRPEGRISPWTADHDARKALFNVGQRLVNATTALGKVATNGWTAYYMPHDVSQAMALVEAIDRYIASIPK